MLAIAAVAFCTILVKGMKVPLNTLVIARPCSWRAKFMIALTEEKTRLTEDEDMPRAKRKSLNRPASEGYNDEMLSCPGHSSR